MKTTHKGFSHKINNHNWITFSLICMVVISALLTSACENIEAEYIVEPREETAIPELGSPILRTPESELNQIPFRFSLNLTHCIAGGVGVNIDIENSEEYSFLWEVNGTHGGHDISSIPCLCGREAKVYIMRLKDGIMISKSIALPPCTSDIK